MIVIIDNYDSFTFNLYQYVGQLGLDVKVFRNDQVTLDQLRKLPIKGFIISPGPGHPSESGISREIIRTTTLPLLGVCLGHQTIVDVHGGRVVHSPVVVHGKTSVVRHRGQGLFAGLTNPLVAARYHSLIADRAALPSCFAVTAETAEGEMMAVEHRKRPIFGVQFHPESIFTQEGHELIQNFVSICQKGAYSYAASRI